MKYWLTCTEPYFESPKNKGVIKTNAQLYEIQNMVNLRLLPTAFYIFKIYYEPVKILQSDKIRLVKAQLVCIPISDIKYLNPIGTLEDIYIYRKL